MPLVELVLENLERDIILIHLFMVNIIHFHVSHIHIYIETFVTTIQYFRGDTAVDFEVGLSKVLSIVL